MSFTTTEAISYYNGIADSELSQLESHAIQLRAQLTAEYASLDKADVARVKGYIAGSDRFDEILSQIESLKKVKLIIDVIKNKFKDLETNAPEITNLSREEIAELVLPGSNSDEVEFLSRLLSKLANIYSNKCKNLKDQLLSNSTNSNIYISLKREYDRAQVIRNYVNSEINSIVDQLNQLKDLNNSEYLNFANQIHQSLALGLSGNDTMRIYNVSSFYNLLKNRIGLEISLTVFKEYYIHFISEEQLAVDLPQEIIANLLAHMKQILSLDSTERSAYLAKHSILYKAIRDLRASNNIEICSNKADANAKGFIYTTTHLHNALKAISPKGNEDTGSRNTRRLFKQNVELWKILTKEDVAIVEGENKEFVYLTYSGMAKAINFFAGRYYNMTEGISDSRLDKAITSSVAKIEQTRELQANYNQVADIYLSMKLNDSPYLFFSPSADGIITSRRAEPLFSRIYSNVGFNLNVVNRYERGDLDSYVPSDARIDRAKANTIVYNFLKELVYGTINLEDLKKKYKDLPTFQKIIETYIIILNIQDESTKDFTKKQFYRVFFNMFQDERDDSGLPILLFNDLITT